MKQDRHNPNIETVAQGLVPLTSCRLGREAEGLRKPHEPCDLLGGEKAELERF
jgi:hypothetical protein